MAVEDTLTEKIGPLPLYAYAIVAGAGVVIVEYVRHKRQGSTAVAAPADPAGTDNGAGTLVDDQTGTVDSGDDGGTTVNVPPAPMTGQYGPITTPDDTAAEGAQDKKIQQLQKVQLLEGVNILHLDQVHGGVHKAHPHHVFYTTRTGDNLGHIAGLYHVSVMALKVNNPELSHHKNSTPIKAGTRVLIP